MEENSINLRAEQLLDEAAFTSSLIKKKERENGSVDPDHMYPISKNETDRMADLLRQAEAVVERPDEPAYREKHDLVSQIVNWSYGRYRTWTWGPILGVLVLALLLFWGQNSSKKKAAEYQTYAAQVEAWTPCDTTITWQNSGVEGYTFAVTFASANNFKRAELAKIKNNYNGYLKNADSWQKYADTAATAEAKENYLKKKAEKEAEAAQARQKFDSVAALNFTELQQMAKNRTERWSGSSKKDSHFFLFNMIFFIVLTILYIWTGYVHGYDLTRTRTRDKIFGWVRKVGYWLAGICFGSGLLMQLFAPDNLVEYVYSNGRRETRSEADLAGTSMNIVFKIGLMFIGICIFVGISVFIMLFETIGGLTVKIRDLKSSKKETVEITAKE